MLRTARASAVRLRDLDAVTLDGHGTLLRLRDPVGYLASQLRAQGVERDGHAIERAFRAEADYWANERLAAHDEHSLAELRVRCAEVFLATLDLDLDRREFAAALAYEYEVLPGVEEALRSLASHGLALAVVANWDFGLHEQLRRHGLAAHFASVVVAAEVGVAKPDPAPFRVALDRLGVTAARALHVGDSAADEEGALAAGLAFAHAPLPAALELLA